jgi:hypothetical protein
MRHDTVRRTFTILGAVIAMMALTATVALGAITWHSGPDFAFNDDGSVTVTGDLSGLGNQPATASIVQSVTAFYTCQNPGGNIAPGQKGVSFTSDPVTQTLSTDKNGRALLDLTAPAIAPDATVNGKTAGCPNGKWTGINPVISEQSATLTITQRGQVIYTETVFA